MQGLPVVRSQLASLRQDLEELSSGVDVLLLPLPDQLLAQKLKAAQVLPRQLVRNVQQNGVKVERAHVGHRQSLHRHTHTHTV